VAPQRQSNTATWVIVGCAILGGLGIIMAILAAILFPVFAQAREKARTASCQSNLKQISLAVLMYCQDYDERLPMSHNWTDATYAYVRNQSLHYCPSAPSQYGYAYNANLGGREMVKIRAPAELVALFESTAGRANAADGGTSLARPGRHSGGDNIGFVDGHVKWMRDTSIAPNLFDPTSSGSPPWGPAEAWQQ
jgi:prepilin-type processing-associated H-X9-DG protein